MKVAYVSNYVPGFHGHVGGAEQALLRNASLSAAQGIDVFFVSLPYNRAVLKGSAFRVVAVQTLESYLPFLKRGIEAAKWLFLQFDIINYFQVLRILKREKPQVLHCGNIQFLTMSVIAAAKRLRIPVVVSVYDYWWWCPVTTLVDSTDSVCRKFHGVGCVQCTPPVLHFVQKAFLAIRRKLFDFFLRRVNRWLVLSESSRRILKDYGISDDRISIVHLPLDIPVNEKHSPLQETPYIFFAGWLQKRKGVHVFLDAFERARKICPNIKAVMVLQEVKWEKEYARAMRYKIQSVPSNAIELYWGQQTTEQMRILLKNAAVVVVPEQWENMAPLILIEAMLLGKPIVASDIGGIPEYIEDGKQGCLASARDAQAFAEKIAFVLAHPQSAADYGDAASRKAWRVTQPQDIAQTLIEVYKKEARNG